jgi:hypothetical protein
MTGDWPPSGHLWRAATSLGSNRGADSSPRDTYGLGGPPALRERCRPKAADGLELVGLAQGKVILAGSTFRREKMRLDVLRGCLTEKSLVKIGETSHTSLWCNPRGL